jgi:hypothetical protein
VIVGAELRVLPFAPARDHQVGLMAGLCFGEGWSIAELFMQACDRSGVMPVQPATDKRAARRVALRGGGVSILMPASGGNALGAGDCNGFWRWIRGHAGSVATQPSRAARFGIESRVHFHRVPCAFNSDIHCRRCCGNTGWRVYSGIRRRQTVGAAKLVV